MGVMCNPHEHSSLPTPVYAGGALVAAADGHGDYLYGLLPCLVFETETRGVFGNGALDVVGDAFGEIGGDFHADFHGGMRVAGQDADDLLGDLHEAHFCRRGIHFGGANEGVGLRYPARCRRCDRW